jgi:putative membrane protein
MTAAADDQAFVTQAAQGGMAEVADGTLASTRASSASVKAYAKKMVADHTKANAQLAAIARKDKFVLPSGIGDDNAQTKGALGKLEGKTFDVSYLQAQVQGHEKMEQVFQKEISTGKNAALVAFAKMTLPTVETHLALAKSDTMRVEAGTSGGSSTNTTPGEKSTPVASPAPAPTQT